MNLSGRKVTLHDMCLRDGMHPMHQQISLTQMVTVAAALDAAGVPLIEVTYGDGLGGGRSSREGICAADSGHWYC